MTDETKDEDLQRATPELSDAEKTAAEKEGVKEAIKKSAETNFLAQSSTESDSKPDRWPDRSDIMQFAGLLDLAEDDFKKKIDAKANPGVPESKIAGLLGLERSGRNRTNFVEMMKKRLGVDSVYEVTNAGPSFTNDTTPTRKL